MQLGKEISEDIIFIYATLFSLYMNQLFFIEAGSSQIFFQFQAEMFLICS